MSAAAPPLPRVQVVGGGPAPPLGSPPAGYASQGARDNVVLLFDDSGASWRLASGNGWISPSSSESAPGLALLSFDVVANAGQARTGSIELRSSSGQSVTAPLLQAGGEFVELQRRLVMGETGRRASFPLIMELGIAGKFIAKEIRELPAEAWLPVLAVVAAVIAALAAAAVAARLAFFLVPEPPDYFSQVPIPMTELLIGQQATLLVAYITEQVLQGS